MHLLLVVAHQHLAEERLPAELALVVVGVRDLCGDHHHFACLGKQISDASMYRAAQNPSRF